MSQLGSLHFAGSDFLLAREDVSEDLAAALDGCGRPGSADEAVAYVRRFYDMTGDEADCRNYLRGYGAWGAEELSDHDANLDRLVWLTGCAFAEGGEAYFSAY